MDLTPDAMDFDLEDLTNLEQAFYDQGYTDGHDHGRIHGLIEGRALGREKGYEIWEEVGFYQGFASFWSAILSADKQSRTLRNVTQLTELIAQYPTRNPSHLANPPPARVQGEPAADAAETAIPMDEAAGVPPPLDMTRIRTKYRLICATLGVKPRPTPAPAPGTSTSSSASGLEAAEAAEVQMRYEDEDAHPRSRAKARKANEIWRIDRRSANEF